ncbi:caspase, EACC1-associated type [Microcoleus vaginatus]|uniref:caspase, EACC1-associated type n=1 Tax=Microcoleus vaginatus TaxID=119532 RepID=UPI0016899573|nr:SUMF1/EgtB/PvdO family nonheme iron enzyme [Microcoleus sp. FACHB-84]MBD2009878.1 SUMF1/EgtB/PvdO family nonheme iron enzyme [Microcoleus sp. FACHB-45]
MAKVGLLIGVSEYEPGLNPLPAAVKDIEALRRVLQDPEMGGFDEVKTLANPEPHAMQLAIETLFDSRAKDDLVLLFFSGHGIKDDAGRLYFASRSTRKNAKENLIRSTAVPASFVHDIMNNSRAKRQAIILDCCFSGAFDLGLQAKDDGSVDLRTQLGAEGRVVLTSSSSTQYSFEQQGSDLSIYTRYLVEGIETGAGDINSDGFVSILELHEYAASKVQQEAPAMTPKIIVIKDKGFEIVLAKARVADPKLKYRKAASRYANAGTIRPAGRAVLNTLRQQLGLTADEAAAIETEVLRPYQERLANLQQYRETSIAEAEHEYPLSEFAREELNTLQQMLLLRDGDVLPIQQEIEALFTQQAEAKRQAQEQAKTSQVSSPQNNVGTKLQRFEFDVITVDKTGKENNRTKKSAEVFAEDLGNGVLLEMVKIRSGTFQMGSPENQGIDNEKPQHSVTVPAFLMGKYPVTQAQWRSVAALPRMKIPLNPDPAYFKGDNRPVEQVSWLGAVEFCQRLSVATGHPYRLPSEAEWEYACRSGTTTEFYFGETITTDLANYRGTDREYEGKTYSGSYGAGPKGIYREQTTDVGIFPPNAYGLYDIHGNVWEWCLDHWHDNFREAPTDGSAWVAGGNSDLRLIRGGSWNYGPALCRAALRLNYHPVDRYYNLGFRVLSAVFPGLF